MRDFMFTMARENVIHMYRRTDREV
jgi:hypothetical protein